MVNLISSKFKVPAILLVLILAAAAPLVFTGYTELRQANTAWSAQDFQAAASHYERAARLLPWRSDLWDRAGVSSYIAGETESAISLLEKARAAGSLSGFGWNVLGAIYWQAGKEEIALRNWQAGLEQHPEYFQTYSDLGMAYRAKGDFGLEQEAVENWLEHEQEARRIYLDALGETSAPFHYRLGQLLAISDSDRALKEFLLASSLDPQYDSAVETMRTALNLASLEPNDAARLIIIGRGLGLVEEWPLAAEAFGQAVDLDEQNAQAWAWLGEANQHLGQEGIEELDQAVALDAESVIVRALRGLYWKRAGNYRAALIDYQAAAELEPENPAWKTALGETYARLGELVSALAVYQSATDLAPQDATNWRLLATFCAEYGVQVQEVGLPAAHKAVELAPNDVLALDVLGWNQLNAELLYSAEQTLLAALEIAPDFPAAHLHLALTYLKKGDRDSAREHLLRVRELDPDGLYGQQAQQVLSQYFP